MQGVKRIRWRLLGLSFYWAWLSVAFFSPVLSSAVSSTTLQNKSFWLGFALSALLTNLVLLLMRKRLTGLVGNAAAMRAAPIVSTMGTILVPFGIALSTFNSDLGTALCLGGSMLAGIGSAFVSLMWGETYSDLDSVNCTAYTIASFALLAILHLLIVSLPAEAGLIATLVLPLAAALPIPVGRHPSRPISSDLPPVKMKASALLPLAAILVLGSCGELLHGLSAYPNTSDATMVMGNLYTIGGLAGTIVYAIVFSLAGNAESIYKSIRVMFVAMAVGLVVSTLISLPFVVVYALFGATFWCFRIATWVLGTRIVHDLGISPLLVFCLSLGAFDLAISLGIPAGNLISILVHESTLSWETVALVAVTCVLLTAMFIFSPKQIEALWGLRQLALPDTTTNENALDALLTETYGLSGRESEVAALLAQGRNLPYIQRELHIAKGTSYTHLRHIYEKMGVHDRQEFLDKAKAATNLRS